MKIMKTNSLMKLINNLIIDLPSPINISTLWNFGSMLGICMMVQMITGLFLSMNYCPNTYLAFESMIFINRNVNWGWFIRNMHMNGASIMFICLYIHISRGIYYSSFMLKETWNIGIMILLLMMGTAFLGYILPWGQMSLWGATVITNLLSTIPYVGKMIVQWLWGGFAISNATLNRFFAMHFILPFMVTALIMMHLIFLHQSGSNNPLGTSSNTNKIPFHPYFTIKDLMSFNFMFFMMTIMILIYPYLMMDSENLIPANPLVTPNHIKPEWYFLFAYAILRSIPNKLGGVMALLMSIMIFFTMPMIKKSLLSMSFYPLNKTLTWMFLITMIMLTWIGAKPVEEPFIKLGKILTYLYFNYFILNWLIFKTWDKLIK